MGELLTHKDSRLSTYAIEEDPFTHKRQKDFDANMWTSYFVSALKQLDPQTQSRDTGRMPITEAQRNVGAYLYTMFSGMKSFYNSDFDVLRDLPNKTSIREGSKFPLVVFVGGKKVEEVFPNKPLTVWSDQEYGNEGNSGVIFVNIDKLRDEAAEYFARNSRDRATVGQYKPTLADRTVSENPFYAASGTGYVILNGIELAAWQALKQMYPWYKQDTRIITDFNSYRTHDREPSHMYVLLAQALLTQQGIVDGTSGGLFNAETVDAFHKRIEQAWDNLPGQILGFGTEWKQAFGAIKSRIDSNYEQNKRRFTPAQGGQREATSSAIGTTRRPVKKL